MTNTEPQGIKDIREAKANYLDALANLRAADAEKVKAEATLVQAQAATEQAKAALKQAKAKAAEIQNEYAAEHNAIELAKVQAAAEVAIKKAEADLVGAEQALAVAEANLAKALQNIAAQALQLTKEEWAVVQKYEAKYNAVIKAQQDVRDAEVKLYNVTYNNGDDTLTSVEVAKAGYEDAIARAEESKAFFEAAIAAHEELTEDQIANYEEWVEKYDVLQAEIAGFEYDKAQIARDSALNDYENSSALDSFYAAIDKKAAAIATARSGFSFAKFEKALPVVSFTKGSVVNTFSLFADELTNVTIADKKITIAASTDKATVKNVVDSLNIIIDALNREKVVVDQIVKDTTGIAALVAKTQHDYDSIKTVLEAGIDKFGGLAEKQKAYEDAKKDAKEKQDKFLADTATLTAKIKEFEKIWNSRVGTVKGDDSTVIWNAFIAVMKARAEVFPNDSAYYCFASPVQKGWSISWKKDSVLFQNLEFAGIQDDERYVKYGNYFDEEGDLWSTSDAFGRVLNKAFGQDIFSFGRYISGLTEKLTDKENYNKLISYDGKYRFNSAGRIWDDGVGPYVPKYVTDEAAKVPVAEGKIAEARQNFYKGIYCTFWGLDEVGSIAETGKDSLKINFTEKTYTDPKVLVTFSGEEGKTVFNPAKDKQDAWIDYQFVNYNDSSLALKAIKEQLGQNNISINEDGKYTLYAKTLAVAQFASAAVNYKENTQALAELTTIVKAVETAYNNAVTAASAGSAKADSLMIALTGKKSGNPIVNHNINAGFIKKDGKGTFNLAGEQKTLAEKWLSDYAKTWSELEKQKADIESTIENNEALADIYAKYVKDLADIEHVWADRNDPDAVYEAIMTKFDGVNALLQSWIVACENNIKKAEGAIQKLEAGYDKSQIDIEDAQYELDEYKKALEIAEAELAVAEAAYKQVLANHGITE